MQCKYRDSRMLRFAAAGVGNSKESKSEPGKVKKKKRSEPGKVLHAELSNWGNYFFLSTWPVLGLAYM